MDILGSTNDSFQKEFFFLGEKYEMYFGLLYSAVALPNLIVPFIGSLLNIKLGLRFMFMINGSFIMIGQFIVFIGISNKSIITMITGRFIYGLGYQNTVICKNQMIIKWFFSHELSIPITITLSLSDLSKFFCFFVSPRVISFVNT